MNKQERTYTILRDRIHSGSFAPLERLNIDALARELYHGDGKPSLLHQHTAAAIDKILSA